MGNEAFVKDAALHFDQRCFWMRLDHKLISARPDPSGSNYSSSQIFGAAAVKSEPDDSGSSKRMSI